MAGRRILFLLISAGCLIFYFAYQEWAAWFLLMAAVCLPVFSFLISLPAMCTTSARLDVPGAVTLGQHQDLAMLYSCRMPAPPWRYHLTVDRPLTGEQWTLRETDDLPTDHCGGLIVTAKKGRIYDYLGLVKLPMKRCRPARVMVRPVPVPVPGFQSPDQIPTKTQRPKPGGGFAENHELRLYRPGDNVQQIHWKLSAKTGKMIIREPMEPVRGRMLVRLDLSGTPHELDRKLGQLLWLGRELNENNIPFYIQCLAGDGIHTRRVTGALSLRRALDELLLCPRALEGTLLDRPESADWQIYIGGDAG